MSGLCLPEYNSQNLTGTVQHNNNESSKSTTMMYSLLHYEKYIEGKFKRREEFELQRYAIMVEGFQAFIEEFVFVGRDATLHKEDN